MRLTHMLSALFCLALVLIGFWPLMAQSSMELPSYEPPPDLRPHALMHARLSRSTNMHVYYSWQPDAKKVRFQVSTRLNPSTNWHPPVDRIETVSFFMTAVAPLRAGDWNSLYVIGVLNNSATVIEKWQLTVTVDATGAVEEVDVQKSNILTSGALTNIRAAAVAPNEQFMLIQNHETHQLLRLDLTSGSTSILLGTGTHPNLQYYDLIEWQEHITAGDVFCVSEGARNHVIQHTSCLLLWDNNLDGVPETIEEITDAEYVSRGYADVAVWQPYLTLCVFE